MKTRDSILEEVKNGRKSKIEFIDSRDYSRLLKFFEPNEWSHFGFEPKKDAVLTKPIEWTKENILESLKGDVEFGFEKALNKRGISASCMNEVIKMWMWVLEDDLSENDDYAEYGLPLLKAVAVKYGFPNEIGDDYGNEYEYSSESE